MTTIMFRLGHSESYNFGLELEDALTTALSERSSFINPTILCGPGNAVFHSEWDNLNYTMTNIHNSNVINYTAGIMIQELKPGFAPTNDRGFPILERSGTRTSKINVVDSLPPVTINKGNGPIFPANAIFTPVNNANLDKPMTNYCVWLFCR